MCQSISLHERSRLAIDPISYLIVGLEADS
jgi:hypothetical protein